MRRTRLLVNLLGPITVAVLAGIGLAAPAHAATWVDNYRNFAHPEQCLIAGRAGLASGTWIDFRCTTISPDTIGPGVIHLDVEFR